MASALPDPDPDPGPVLSAKALAALLLALVLAGLGLAQWWRSNAAASVELRIATGRPGGTYHALGEALAAQLPLDLPGATTRVLATQGSAANAELLARGDAELAFLQNDTDVEPNLRCVASLYQEVLHIVVVKDAARPIRRPLDLAGRRLALGGAGSGTESVARQVLEHFGLAENGYQQVDATVDEAAELLLAGELDALFVLSGLRSAVVERLLQSERVELLSLDFGLEHGDGADALQAVLSSLQATAIPAYAYGRRPERPVRSVQVTAMLMTREDVDEEVVRGVTQALFSHRRLWADAHPALVRMREAFDPVRAPAALHRGARAYRERDEPEFFVQYAEAISLGLTLLVGLGSGLLALREWARGRRKNRIDVYYLELTRLSAQIAEAPAEQLPALRRQLNELRRRAFQDLVAERIAADTSFVIFQDFLREELRSVVARAPVGGR